MPGTDQKTTLELKLEKLRQICHKSPDNAIGLLALAETAFRRGLRLEALEAYQKVLKDESVAEAHLCMAQMYRHHGLFQETINELRVLFEIERGYPEAHVFARELAKETTLPEDLEAVLHEGCGGDELALARVRLSIARSLVLREGQELVAIQDANANDPTFGYYIGETRKRLSYCEQVLSQLSVLEDARRNFLAEQERHRQIEQERLRELAERQASQPAAELLGPPTPTSAELVEPVAALDLQAPAPSEAPAFEDELADGPQATSPVVIIDEDAQHEPASLADTVAAGADEWQDEPEVAVDTPAGFAAELEHEPAAEPQPEPDVFPDDADLEPVSSGAEPSSGFADTVMELGLGIAAAFQPAAPEPRVQEPALWDDGPRLGMGDPAADLRRPPHPDPELTFDMTPTLVGDLPEPPQPSPVERQPEPEPESEPLRSSGLWDDDLAPPEHLSPAPPVRPALPSPSELQDGAPEPVRLPEPEPTVAPALLSLPTTVEPEPAPEPVGVAEAEPQPSPVQLQEEPVAAADTPDFAAVYAPLLGNLENLIQTLAKTRGVSSVFLVNRQGYCVCEIIRDTLDRERVSEFIVETVAFLEGYASQPQYWVLECAGGIVVIQSVDNHHFLLTIGQTGANFGALRYTMDRVRPSFEQVLQPAIPAA